MDKFKTISMSLTLMIVVVVGSVFINSCSKEAVTAIEPVEYVQPVVLPQLVGVVTDKDTDAPIVGATLTLNGSVETTDAQGAYSFDAPLSAGETSMKIEASGYMTVTKTVDVPAEGGSLNKSFILVKTAPTVTVTAAGGGEVEQTSDEGTVEASIPPAAVATDTQVSVTPTLGTSSPVDVNEVVTAVDEAPAQNVTVSPADIQFTQPVTMKAPLSFPAEFLTGESKVVRINPTTGEAEEVAGATVVDGKFQYDITQGGQYIVKAKTNLRHTVTERTVAQEVGALGPNAAPGSFQNFSITEETTVDVADGFSRNFIEGVFGFSASSRSVSVPISKPTGANTAVKGFVSMKQTEHTYATASGQIIAKITQNESVERQVLNIIVARWSYNATHGTYTFLGYFIPGNPYALSSGTISAFGLNPNPSYN